ncbi:cell division site-positioning protein MapZ family protein [Enterococcus sp. AZ196]|uniref:cell division site-positioning protein MapZ family protein n=1 Tax=Enterococcus sp. AZ196 TaxID=2774659 RepID=UPI003D282815
MQKCPNCGFEPVKGCTTCPKCGFSLQLNDREHIEKNNEKNDTIEWSELADMPIESVQKMFKDNEDKMKEENSKETTEETPEMNPILAQYIREHKDDQEKSVNDEDETKNESENASEADSVNDEIEETKADNLSEAKDQNRVEDSTVPEEELEDPADKNIPEAEESVAAEEETLSETTEPVSPELSKESEAANTDVEETVEHSGEENISLDDSDKPQEPRKKNRKKLYITLTAIAVLGLGGGYYYHHEKEVEAQRIATVKKENEALDSIEDSIASYYTDDKQIFLASDKVALNTSKIDEELSRYKDNKRYDELKKEYNELVEKQKAEQSVNQLFTSVAINGDKITEKPLLSTAEPVELSINTGDKEFDDLMNQAVNNAKEQYTKIETAKKAVEGLLKDGNVVDSVNRDQYNTANNAVKAVANQTLVQSQRDDLSKVDQTLKDKEKKAAEEKAAAEKAAREKEEQERAAQEAQNKASSTGNNNQVGDTSSSAYAWAPGVKEKVIQTCISRGYIVEGGYSLEPVKVENGEGYYNLYATSNQASLTKGYSDSDLPMYLVTINCKTGWFKGDGPN